MIRQTVTALAAALAVFCAASKTLSIYSVTGNVAKKTQSGWTTLSKPGKVADSDIIKINPASKLKVIDDATRRVYTFDEQGEAMVKRLMDQSQRESSSISSRMVAESRRRMSATKSHEAVGAVNRDTFDEELLEALFTALSNGLAAGENTGSVTMSKIDDGDGMFHLSLTNNGDKEMYANVFCRTADAPWDAVYRFDGEESAVWLAPGDTVELPHVTLAATPGLTLAAVAYPAPFEGADLADMFAAGLTPESAPATDVSFFFINL